MVDGLVAVKATRICDGKIWFISPGLEFENGDGECAIDLNGDGHECTEFDDIFKAKDRWEYDSEYDSEYDADYQCDHFFVNANKLHALHPWFPNHNAYSHDIRRPIHFHKNIMKTFYVVYWSLKLIVRARRIKEKMYAPGGTGFIAAKEDFDRVAKAVYEHTCAPGEIGDIAGDESFDRAAKAIYKNFEQADRAAAKRVRFE